MKKEPNLLLKFSLIAFVVLGGLFLVTSTIAAYQIPRQAEKEFGKPSSNLSQVEKLWLSARLVLVEDLLTQANDGPESEQSFRIEHGESAQSIAARLQAEGFIKDAGVLMDYLVYTGLDTTLQAGEFRLSRHMTAIEIALRLQDATPSEVTFNVLPGWRMEEIAASLPTSGLSFSGKEFLDRGKQLPESFVTLFEAPQSASLEGFLFPGSYQLPRDIALEDFINVMLENFASNMETDWLEAYKRQGMSVYQAVILASIIQREAVKEEEMPQIASVFFNRLARGMKLDSDPTVQYALGFNASLNTWWTNPLSAESLSFDSPFNTYVYADLPPAPICNPSPLALRAVAYPVLTSYLYFRASCDGSGLHLFAETLEAHLANACP